MTASAHLPNGPAAAPRGSAPRTLPATLPETETGTRPHPSDGDGDHDRFTHYVSKRELERARRKGTAVTALCGKRWIPDGDPSRYPMCPTCAEIAAERLVGGLGG